MIPFSSYLRLFIFVIVMMSVEVVGSENNLPTRFSSPNQIPQTRYEIDVAIDSANNRFEGREAIHVLNSTKLSLKRFVIDCPDSIKEPKITCQDNPVKVVAKGTNGLPNSQTVIELQKTLEPGESIELEVQFGYTLMLGNFIQLVNWHPRLWWERNSHADFEVTIENVPKEYAIATSGVFDETKKCYIAKDCGRFGLVFMKNMNVIQATSGDTAIYSYYDKNTRKCVEFTHQTAIEAVAFYRDWLGFYPHKILHIVPGGQDRPVGGYPIATAIVGIHGQSRMNEKPESHWRFISAHEIGHQYWMEHVLEAPNTFWLMIGLGVYADREFMRTKGYGDEHERDMIERYITGMRDLLDTRMNRSADEIEQVDFDYNNVVVHGKGFSVISALACTLGKEIFDSVYRRCLNDYKGRTLGVADFQRACEEESGEKLDWFFDQWIQTNHFLLYEIASQESSLNNGNHETTVKVRKRGTMRMPVPVTAFFEDGTSQNLLSDRLLDECVLKFTSTTPVKEIKIDAKGELPFVSALPDKTTVQLKNMIQELGWTGEGDTALRIFNDIQNLAQEKTGFYWFKLGLCLFDGRHYEEALQAFVNDYEENPNSFATLVWQGHILDLMNRREEALSCYKRALEMKPTSFVRHDQYGIKIDLDWIEDRLETPFQRD